MAAKNYFISRTSPRAQWECNADVEIVADPVKFFFFACNNSFSLNQTNQIAGMWPKLGTNISMSDVKIVTYPLIMKRIQFVHSIICFSSLKIVKDQEINFHQQK